MGASLAATRGSMPTVLASLVTTAPSHATKLMAATPMPWSNLDRAASTNPRSHCRFESAG
jgi:hypothetical protein